MAAAGGAGRCLAAPAKSHNVQVYSEKRRIGAPISCNRLHCRHQFVFFQRGNVSSTNRLRRKMPSNPQVPWTEEQWARVNQAIQEEAQRVRVAAKFLPLYGPLPADTDFVRKVDIPAGAPLTVNDTTTIE